MALEEEKKMKIICLHGFRTSGKILEQQIGKWDPAIFSDFEMDFLDGLFPSEGKSEIQGIFPGPYFEWFQFDKDFYEYPNLEKCISHLCEYIEANGPFDGILGFSQGATLSALLLGYQKQGIILKNHPKMKLFICISGTKFRIPEAYKEAIDVKSVHFIGEKDHLKVHSEDLATSAFVDPLIIRHPQGHTIPRLNEGAIEKIKGLVKEVGAAD